MTPPPFTGLDKAPLYLPIDRLEQPDETTCGPTCLTKVYRYYGHDIELEKVIEGTERNEDGGTLGVFLGIHALKQGFDATLHPFSFRVMDPTWEKLSPRELRKKLLLRAESVRKVKLQRACEAHAEFIALGGRIDLRELRRDWMILKLIEGFPLLTGLSATALYRSSRERNDKPDDVAGSPVGHFVVVAGYDTMTDEFLISDPERELPDSLREGQYRVEGERLISAILLGEATYDANMLVIQPRNRRKGQATPRG